MFAGISITVFTIIIALTKCSVIKLEKVESDECSISKDLLDEISSYTSIANKIINETLNGPFKSRTYKELANFVDKFGHRFTGSESLEESIKFILDKLNHEGLENVHGEEVEVPHWIRGEEYATLVSPRIQNLPILGLGSSIGTGNNEIEAEAIVVNSFFDLKNKTKNQIEGKIVIFVPKYTTYKSTVGYRYKGASEASALGAVAVLIRSITPFSMSTPHAGWQKYSDDVKEIPAASITVEDAKMLQRIQDRGEKIIVRLKMEAKNMPNKVSMNVVAELIGRVVPEKAVIVSGHIDSWDVGQGAMDDGGGAFISWTSLVLLKNLGLRPKRTLRCVLWTAEEVGLIGAREYANTHKNESNNIMIAMESDEGTFKPLGLNAAANPYGRCILKEILKLLQPLNATNLKSVSSAGSDIQMLHKLGIPTVSLLNDNDKYFWFHHTAGDTMDVENQEDLDKNTALWAIVSYVLADLSIDFPREGRK